MKDIDHFDADDLILINILWTAILGQLKQLERVYVDPNFNKPRFISLAIISAVLNLKSFIWFIKNLPMN